MRGETTFVSTVAVHSNQHLFLTAGCNHCTRLMDAHLSKLLAYNGNWAKSEWEVGTLLQVSVLFRGTTLANSLSKASKKNFSDHS